LVSAGKREMSEAVFVFFIEKGCDEASVGVIDKQGEQQPPPPQLRWIPASCCNFRSNRLHNLQAPCGHWT
jgi:hypothetical protein